jgi:hypothetical protein
MSSKSPTTEQPTDGWTNNIDWNNAITGSPANTVELKIDEVQTQSVTNAIDVVPTEKP